MDGNPYENLTEVSEPLPPTVSGAVLAVAVVIAGQMGALGIAIDEGALFFAALFAGVPLVSFLAGHGRSQNPVATAGAGIFIAIAGIIAFLPVCGVIGTLSGMGIHGNNNWVVSSIVCGGSISLACVAVIWMHTLRGRKAETRTQEPDEL